MASGIYIIHNTQNGYVYIGQAKDIDSRWGQHRHELTKKRHPNHRLQSAWDTHGADAFMFSVLEPCPREILNEREQHYLDTYMPLGFCYNIKRRANPLGSGRKLPKVKERSFDYLHGNDLDDVEKVMIMALRKGGKIRVLCLLAALADDEAEFLETFLEIQKLLNPEATS